MFVEVFSNNGNKYLRLVEGYYTKDKNGNPTCRKKVIKCEHKRFPCII